MRMTLISLGRVSEARLLLTPHPHPWPKGITLPVSQPFPPPPPSPDWSCLPQRRPCCSQPCLWSCWASAAPHTPGSLTQPENPLRWSSKLETASRTLTKGPGLWEKSELRVRAGSACQLGKRSLGGWDKGPSARPWPHPPTWYLTALSGPWHFLPGGVKGSCQSAGGCFPLKG